MTATLDWYQGTIEGFPRDISNVLMEMPGAVKLEGGRGRNNYLESVRVMSAGGDTLATTLFGGLNGSPNAFASGVNSEPFAAIIRRCWPDAHTVSRLDSAVDLLTDFGAMHSACQAIAADLRIRGHSIVPDNPAEGATYYMGADTSRIRFRLYEKGKLLIKQGVEADPRLVRFEVQLRPEKVGKRRAAYLSADEAWGASHWIQRIAADLLHMAPDRVILQPRPLTTFDRRHTAFLMQYGPHMQQLLANAGSPASFGERLAQELAR